MRYLLTMLIISSTVIAQDSLEQKLAARDSAAQALTASLAAKPKSDSIVTITRARAKRFWISGDVGGVGMSGGLGAGASIGFTSQFNKKVTTIRIEGAPVGGIAFSGLDVEHGDFAILFGRRKNGPKGFTVASIGVSLLIGNKKGAVISSDWLFASYEYIPIRTIGVPLELQVIRTFGSNFGIGHTLYANFNSESTYLSAMLSLNFGKLKY